MKRKTKAQRARRIKEKTAKNKATREQGQNVDEEAPVKLERARHITQLELLLSRGNITDRQYEAGDRLYRDWRASGSEPRLVPQYTREIGLGGDGFAEYQVDARYRFQLALAALNPRQRAVAIHVCLLDEKLASWTGERLVISESMMLLREALDALILWQDHRKRLHFDFRIDSPKMEMVEL
jgi:Domain of unknown function (DUF6456)